MGNITTSWQVVALKSTGAKLQAPEMSVKASRAEHSRQYMRQYRRRPHIREKYRQYQKHYHETHKEQEDAYNRRYYLQHRDDLVRYTREYYRKHKKEINYRKRFDNREYLEQNRDRVNSVKRIWAEKTKILVIQHYSSDLKCQRCGNNDFRVLSIDHILGGGRAHVRENKIARGSKLYRWLIHNNFPSGFQVLCMNCQWIKRHERKEWEWR